MRAYASLFAATCSVETLEGCDEQETAFVEKWKAKSPEDAAAQVARLNKLTDGTMTAERAKWVKQRIAIFKQLAPVEAEL